MFYLLPEDILVKIISYSSSNNLKKIIILNKNFNNFLRKSYADIIFYNIINKKYKFFNYTNNYLFKKNNNSLSICKNNKNKNKIDVLINYKLII